MTMAQVPARIVSDLSKAHLVRQVALELNVSYEEWPVPERPDLIRFAFPPMDEEFQRKLVLSVPREAFAYQGIVVGAADPREHKA